jgi:hypothetical protein
MFVSSFIRHVSEVLRSVERREWRTVQTRLRELILEPSKNSDVKIERYSFPIAYGLILGKGERLTTVTGKDRNDGIQSTPSVYLRPQRVTSNCPIVGFLYLDSIIAGNIECLVGIHAEDAFNYCAGAYDSVLDIPTISPGIPLKLRGFYTGLIPNAPYKEGEKFLFSISFKGPASMTA